MLKNVVLIEGVVRRCARVALDRIDSRHEIVITGDQIARRDLRNLTVHATGVARHHGVRIANTTSIVLTIRE